MRMRLLSPRAGTSLPELLVSLVVLGIVGSASVRLLVSQTRFYDVQVKQRSARAVSRASVNAILSELRMVESTGGLEAATPTSVTLRVPYAMGMVCGHAGVVSVVAMLPADSTVLATATPSGHAWRSASGNYTYTNGTIAAGAVSGAEFICNAANISAVPGGRVVAISPRLPAGAQPGDAAFLYQRVRYEFAWSDALPGRRALWREIVDSGTREEMAAPFDFSSRFRFFHFERDTSDASANLPNIRGLELLLNGASQTRGAGEPAPERALFATAVYFNNRIN